MLYLVELKAVSDTAASEKFMIRENLLASKMLLAAVTVDKRIIAADTTFRDDTTERRIKHGRKLSTIFFRNSRIILPRL